MVQTLIMNIVMAILMRTKLQIYTLQVTLMLELELEILISLTRLIWKNMPDDGVFNISQNSNHDVNNDVESNGSQAKLKDDHDNW